MEKLKTKEYADFFKCRKQSVHLDLNKEKASHLKRWLALLCPHRASNTTSFRRGYDCYANVLSSV